MHRPLRPQPQGQAAVATGPATVAAASGPCVCGIMEASRSAAALTWEDAMNSKLNLSPSEYAFTSLETDPVPVPGRTPLI